MPEVSRDRRLAAPTGLFLLAFAIRCSTWGSVFGVAGTERPLFFGNDAYYHMRRVAWSLAHYPGFLGFDASLNHPQGAHAIWPPLFDLAVATLLLPVYAIGGLEAAEQAAMFVAPLLGALAVVALWALALRIFDPTVALMAGLVASVLSGHFWYSQLGFLDHHAAVALLAIGLLIAALSSIDRASRGRSVVLGSLLAASLLVWPGALLYVATIEVGLLVHWMAEERSERSLEIARSRVLAHGIAFAIVVGFWLLQGDPQWEAYSPTVLSLFQPWLFAALVLHAGILWLWWLRSSAPRRTARSAVEIGVVGCGVLGGSFLLFPELAAGAGESWQWLSRDELFQSLVGESEPLFSLGGRFTTQIAELRLSRFVYVAPFVLLALCVDARNDPRRAARWFVAFFFAVCFVATLQQKRFFNTASLGVALLMAWAGVELARRVAAKLSAPRWLPGLVVAALAGWLLWPTLAAYDARTGRGLGGKPQLVETARWIRENTPPGSGVVTHWDLGHLLLYESQRPQVVGNFGDDLGGPNFQLARRYFLSNESGAVPLLDQLEARYVVVESVPPARWRRLARGTMVARLTADRLEDLQEHRLLYESPPVESEFFVPSYRVFERVPGVEVVGRASPGATVTASLDATLPGGVERSFVHRAVADPSGEYRLRLAQTADDEPWQLSCRKTRATLVVPETSGRAALQAPTLCPPR